jgi:curved DNA-binding protein
MKDLYKTLGVAKNATADEIKRAYRRLASKHHPDRGGDTKMFQEIQTAYDTLIDSNRRAAYDNPRPDFGNFESRGQGPFDFQTIFDIFGTRFQQPHQRRQQQARMNLWVTLVDVAQGVKKTISIGTPAGTTAAEIDVPAGINDGDSVQYSGLGPGGIDLVIAFRIHPDPRFQRDGVNLLATQSVSVWDLVSGADVVVRDILGNSLSLSIPPRTQPGTMFRLRGRGLAHHSGTTGDLLVRVQAVIPDHISPELIDQINQERGR